MSLTMSSQQAHAHRAHIYSTYIHGWPQISDRCSAHSHKCRQHQCPHPALLSGWAGWRSISGNTYIYVQDGSAAGFRHSICHVDVPYLLLAPHTCKCTHTHGAGPNSPGPYSWCPCALTCSSIQALLHPYRLTHSPGSQGHLTSSVAPAFLAITPALTHPHSLQLLHHGHTGGLTHGLAPVAALRPLYTHKYTAQKVFTQERVREEFKKRIGTGHSYRSILTSQLFTYGWIFLCFYPSISHTWSSSTPLSHLCFLP